jgi:dihydrofolate reductase
VPRAQRLYLTEVDAEVEGDVSLAPFDESRWRETSRETYPASDKDEYPFTIRVLERP